MTINVHADHDHYADRDDLICVGRTEYPAQHGKEAFARLEYASRERTCLHKMRGWKTTSLRRDERTGRVYEQTETHDGFCLLDKGHKGRHSTVVFYCDGCGKARRGAPTQYGYDGNGEIDVSFCFMCTHVATKWL